MHANRDLTEYLMLRRSYIIETETVVVVREDLVALESSTIHNRLPVNLDRINNMSIDYSMSVELIEMFLSTETGCNFVAYICDLTRRSANAELSCSK